MKLLNVLIILVFTTISLLSNIKDIPGGIGEVRNTESVGDLLLSESSDYIHIYNLKEKRIINTFGREYEKYAATEKYYFIIVKDTVKKFNLSSGQLLSKTLVTDIISNEYVYKLKPFEKSIFILQTNKSLYLVNEEDYQATKILDIKNDFKASYEGKGVFYNEGFIYYIDSNFNVEKYKFTIDKEILDFNYSNRRVIYNYVDVNKHFIESINLNNNKKSTISTTYMDEIVIMGDKVISYKNFSTTSLDISSLDLEAQSSVSISIDPFIDDFQFINGNILIASSLRYGNNYLININDKSIKRVNYFDSGVEAFSVSNDNKYICAINERQVKTLQIIDLKSQEIKKTLLFEHRNSFETIYFTKSQGFVFQSAPRVISGILPENSFDIEFDYRSDKDITSFNINEKYLFVGDKDGLKIIDLLTQDIIKEVPTSAEVRFVNIHNNNCLFSNKKNDLSELYYLNLSDLYLDSVKTIELYTGFDEFPINGVTDSLFYQVDNWSGRIGYYKIGEEEFGRNHLSIRADNIKAAVSINDSIYIGAFSNPETIKKFKINYETGGFEILKDYDLKLQRGEFEKGGKVRLPITKLAVNNDLIIYTTIVDNTIRFIEDDELITSVTEEFKLTKIIEEIIYNNYNFKIYDISGKDLTSKEDLSIQLEKLRTSTPYILSYTKKNEKNIYKFIK